MNSVTIANLARHIHNLLASYNGIGKCRLKAKTLNNYRGLSYTANDSLNLFLNSIFKIYWPFFLYIFLIAFFSFLYSI